MNIIQIFLIIITILSFIGACIFSGDDIGTVLAWITIILWTCFTFANIDHIADIIWKIIKSFRF